MYFLRSAFILLVLCLLAGFALGQDDDVISVDSSVVVVNASVTGRDGAAVAGLKQEQFTVLDDGVAQKLDYFAAESTPFAAVILIDRSGSMESRLASARAAALKFLERLRGEDFAAVCSFDSKVLVVHDFSSMRDMPDAFFDLKADGMTALNDAVFKASAMLSTRPEKRRAIVVISDGADNISKHSDEKALTAALDVGATIYTVDMSPEDLPRAEKAAMQGALKKFASRTGGTFVAAAGGPAMRDAFRSIVDELGQQYTLVFQPTDAKHDGKFHSIEVRVARGGLTIRTRKGYRAPKDKPAKQQ